MTPLQALQATLAGEHAAVYLYGVLGARSSLSAHPVMYRDMLDAFRLHRRRRDELNAIISGKGADPVAAAVSYDVPGPDPSSAVPEALNEAALEIERRLATTYGQLLGSTSGGVRRWALTALEDCAVRQLAFRGIPEMFPGLAP